MSERRHGHYFKHVEFIDEIDVYRVCDLFGVKDSAIAHAIKKLLLPGGRGAGKGMIDDVREARDTLNRRLEMWEEDARVSEKMFSRGVDMAD